MDERVVITGLGTINPNGHSTKEIWENINNGVSGVNPITLFDASDLNVQIACEVKSHKPLDHMSAREARHRDRFEHFVVIAANQAIAQSGLRDQQIAADKVGVIISTVIDHHFQGPSYSVSSACASGSDAIGTGCMLIKATE